MKDLSFYCCTRLDVNRWLKCVKSYRDVTGNDTYPARLFIIISFPPTIVTPVFLGNLRFDSITVIYSADILMATFHRRCLRLFLDFAPLCRRRFSRFVTCYVFRNYLFSDTMDRRARRSLRRTHASGWDDLVARRGRPNTIINERCWRHSV